MKKKSFNTTLFNK